MSIQSEERRVTSITPFGENRGGLSARRPPCNSGSTKMREQIQEALNLLLNPLREFVGSRMQREYGEGWMEYALGALHASPSVRRARREDFDGDLSTLLNTVGRFWNVAFRRDGARFARPYFDEIREFRNALAHGDSFTLPDAFRAVDTVHRLLAVIGHKDRSRSGHMRASLIRQMGGQHKLPHGANEDDGRSAGDA